MDSGGSELRDCVNREVGLGYHSLSRSFPVPNKPYGFCGRKAPWKRGNSSGRAQSPGAIKSKEVELGSHSRMDCLVVELSMKSALRAQERSRAGRWSWAVMVGWIVLLLSMKSALLKSPGEIKSREVELRCYGWVDCLAVVSEECIKSVGEIKRREVELGSWLDGLSCCCQWRVH